MRARGIQRAFTLIELLVVIAIIAILMALLVPAVQKVREASRSMQCKNHLHQIGVALHNFESDYKRLPPGGVMRAHDWGATNIGAQDLGTWLVFILPYMEQTDMWEEYYRHIHNYWLDPTGPPAVNPPARVPGVNYFLIQLARLPPYNNWLPPPANFYRCPSDINDYVARRGSNYIGSLGATCATSQGICGAGFMPYQFDICGQPGPYPTPPGITWSAEHGNSYSASHIRGLFNRLGAKFRLADIPDGTSNTIMVGEEKILQNDHLWAWSHFNGGAAHATTLPPINYETDRQVGCPTDPLRSWQNWNLSWGFKSYHPGGANFLMADGSVHFLNQYIDHTMYQYLGARDDGKHANIPTGAQ